MVVDTVMYCRVRAVGPSLWDRSFGWVDNFIQSHTGEDLLWMYFLTGISFGMFLCVSILVIVWAKGTLSRIDQYEAVGNGLLITVVCLIGWPIVVTLGTCYIAYHAAWWVLGCVASIRKPRSELR